MARAASRIRDARRRIISDLRSMPIPYRRELTSFLEEFAADHRGARLGRMFGLPALYAGRRLFACLIEEGLIVRLPDDVARQEYRSGGKPFSRGRPASPRRPMGAWVLYEPRTATAARRLAPMLEIAARHVARRQAEELTGVKLATNSSAPTRTRPPRSRGRKRTVGGS